MKPRIVHVDAFSVMGTLTRVDYTTNPDFQGIWDVFMAYHDQIEPHSTEKAYYGVSYATGQDDVVDYLTGMPVGDVPTVPEPLVLREVPATLCAMFEFPFAEMGNSIGHALQVWLPSSEYERDLAVAVTDFLRFGSDPVLFYLAVRQAAKGLRTGTG